MDFIMSWLNGFLDPILPADIFSRLDVLYNASIITLGVGVCIMLIAMVLMIASVRKSKKRASA